MERTNESRRFRQFQRRSALKQQEAQTKTMERSTDYTPGELHDEYESENESTMRTKKQVVGSGEGVTCDLASTVCTKNGCVNE